MLLSEEIIQLHKKMEEREQERVKGNIDSAKEDDFIANMATTAGWDILKAKAESMIAELLEPVDFSDETPLDVRGAVNEARRFALEVLRKLIGQVESIKAAKTFEKLEQSEEEEIKEESDPEA